MLQNKWLKRLTVLFVMMSLLAGFMGISFAAAKPAPLKKYTFGSRILKVGSRGTDVQYLQNFLKTKKYFKSASSGYFGTLTKSAVIAYQKKNKIKADGIMGKTTYNVIKIEIDRAKKPTLKPVTPPVVIKPTLEPSITLATTTSTQDSGLLNVLIPAFEKKFGVKVKVVAVGTGQAIQLGKDGNADVLLVHSRKDEDAFVSDGYGLNAWDVCYNQFYLVGPESDPAHVFNKTSIVDAFKAIAASGAKFVSRGDNSGTNKKELTIWSKTGITPAGKSWYLSTGQGMGETLQMADEMGAYTLTDEATFLTQKGLSLKVAVAGDQLLLNPYGVIKVKTTKAPKASDAFISYVVSPEGQKIIRDFGKTTYGKSLFVPNAKKR